VVDYRLAVDYPDNSPDDPPLSGNPPQKYRHNPGITARPRPLAAAPGRNDSAI
jgi:hypothetical protein